MRAGGRENACHVDDRQTVPKDLSGLRQFSQAKRDPLVQDDKSSNGSKEEST